MVKQSSTDTLHSQSDLWWLVDGRGTLVVDARAGDSRWLEGTEAVVWQWLQIGYSVSKIIRLVSELENNPDGGKRNLAESQQVVVAIIEKWRAAGWLIHHADQAVEQNENSVPHGTTVP
jgi:hypothetical protein